MCGADVAPDPAKESKHMTSINPLQQNAYQPPPPPGGNDAGRASMDKVMSGMADYLGMSTDELKEAQRNGTTLADLAAQKGISEDALESKLAEELKANKPADAPSDIDFSQMASDIANGKGPGGHRGHGGGVSRLNSDGSNTSSVDLGSLLQSLGKDLSSLGDLFEQATSTTSSSGSDSSDSSAVTTLRTLLQQYGSKGLAYDTKL
jgi:hypothetical protein